ncbi:UNVERIFIED_CONTAM: hypothetical protein FKN15_063666 [Acipenser sinensis]
MSQFMDLMMGQQSLLMSLATARAAEEPVGPVANQPMILPQPLSVPVAQQDAWDVDAISRDASEGEPLPGEGSVEAELTSHHSESEMEVGVDESLWSLVERATRHLGIEWPAVDQPRWSLFESPSAQGQQSFLKARGLAELYSKAAERPPRKLPCKPAPLGAYYTQRTENHFLFCFQPLWDELAALVKDLPDYPSLSLRTELGLIAQLLFKLAQLNARAQGRSIASLVVARRQLWLSLPCWMPQLHRGTHLAQRWRRCCNAQLRLEKHHSSWPRYGRVGLSSPSAHKNISGVGHHHSTSRAQGVLRPPRRVQQRAANFQLGNRSAQGGALEEVVGNTPVALAKHLADGRSQSSPEEPRQLLTHPYAALGLKSKRGSDSPRAAYSKLPGGWAYTPACAEAYRQLCYKAQPIPVPDGNIPYLDGYFLFQGTGVASATYRSGMYSWNAAY